jgi:hypothetical protein
MLDERLFLRDENVISQRVIVRALADEFLPAILMSGHIYKTWFASQAKLSQQKNGRQKNGV